MRSPSVVSEDEVTIIPESNSFQALELKDHLPLPDGYNEDGWAIMSDEIPDSDFWKMEHNEWTYLPESTDLQFFNLNTHEMWSSQSGEIYAAPSRLTDQAVTISGIR